MSRARKPKIAFVHPLGCNWVPGQKDVTRIANVMPPHGIMMIAAYLERNGYDSSIIDCFSAPATTESIVNTIIHSNVDIVGFSTTTSSFLAGYSTALKIREAAPRVKILFGGVHATSLWRELLERFPAIDFIAAGEGEETTRELLESDLEPGGGIPGLAWREGEGGVRYGGDRPLIRYLDALPFPAYGKLKDFPSAYPLPIFNYPRSPATTLITSRGCPYTCSYCDRSVFRSTFRGHSAEYLVEHLAYLKERFGIRHVNIYDDNFTLDRRRVVAFAELLLKRRLGTTFNCIGRANHLDKELLDILKRAGCWMINLGVESGDQALIAKHRSRCDLEELGRVVREVRAAGIRAKGLFMMGIPGETEESIRLTLDYALNQPFDDLNVTKFTPFPGAPIYREIRKWGEFDEDWEKMNCLNFVFVPTGFTKERLEHSYARFLKSYYKRPAALARLASMLWKSPESVVRFLRHLPDFLAVRKQMENAIATSP